MFSDIGKRLIASGFSIGLVTALLVVVSHPILRYFTVAAVIALVAVGTWEYVQFVHAKGIQLSSTLVVGFVVIFTLSFFVSSQISELYFLPGSILLLLNIILFALAFSKSKGAIFSLSTSIFPFFYIAVPFGGMLQIFYLPGIDGRMWIIYLLLVTKVMDAGAYVGGNLWGRHKLASHISPGKTVEGTIFGLFAALFVSFLFYLLGQWDWLSFRLGQWEWIGFGIGFASLGQFGDLAESLLKRDANKKDSNSLPGFGGVLDLVDSLLFNLSLLYIYLLTKGYSL